MSSSPGTASPLVSRTELADLLASAAPPVVLDVRWRLGGPPGIDSYLAGHLPGACFIDLETDLSGRPGPLGRHPLPDVAVFEAAMRRAGLHVGQLAVAYDDGDSTIAARLWWMLRYYGHRHVAVLDGGYAGWAAAGMPLTTVPLTTVPLTTVPLTRGANRPAPGDFVAATVGAMPVLSEVEAGQLARSGFLLDARAAERYRGDVEPIDRIGGHIPGAISAPTKENVGSDGEFLAPSALASRFASLGLPSGAELRTGPDGPPVIGTYCGSGVTAAHQVLALELAGLPAALYVGSWSQWSFDPARPVATGPAPG